MNEAVRDFIRDLGPAQLRAIEVSGRWFRDIGWLSYRSTEYPQFDLVKAGDDFDGWGQADLVLCEQVLEHVCDPIKAMRNLTRLARPGGTVIVSTPFLVRIHAAPDDYWRFTPRGLALLMRHAGLETITVESWGNRRCVKSNFRRWTPARPWRSNRNEPDFPIQVWGSGVRPSQDPAGI
jgi:SAM-dependent methyltransferase